MVVDYKTGKHPGSQLDVDNNMQLTFYAIACRELGIPVDELCLQFFSPPTRYITTRCQKDYDHLLSVLQRVRAEIEAEQFPKKKTPLCNFCGYQNICKEN